MISIYEQEKIELIKKLNKINSLKSEYNNISQHIDNIKSLTNNFIGSVADQINTSFVSGNYGEEVTKISDEIFSSFSENDYSSQISILELQVDYGYGVLTKKENEINARIDILNELINTEPIQ